jgi:hypothetical protein
MVNNSNYGTNQTMAVAKDNSGKRRWQMTIATMLDCNGGSEGDRRRWRESSTMTIDNSGGSNDGDDGRQQKESLQQRERESFSYSSIRERERELNGKIPYASVVGSI